MRTIKAVEIENILGIKGLLRFQAAGFTVLHGDNEVGKTSILQALQIVFEGGHDAEWIHHGAPFGRVQITLSDDTEISARVKPKETNRLVKSPDGSTTEAVATWLKKVVSDFGINPLALIDAKPKERIEEVVKALGLTFTSSEVTPITHRQCAPVISLEQLKAIIEGFTTERRDVGRSVKEWAGFVATAKAAVEDGGEGDDELTEAVSTLESNIAELRQEMADGKATLMAQLEKRSAEIRAEAEAKIAKLKNDAQETLDRGTAQINTEIADKSAKLAEYRQRLQARTRAAGARDQIAQLEKQIEDGNRQVEDLTEQITQLQGLKDAKLNNLPIKGLDIRDGELYVDGVAWPHVNTANQYAVVCQLATIRSGDLPLLVIDKAETIAAENFDNFIHACEKNGVQVFAARVTEGPLQIVDGGTNASLFDATPSPYDVDEGDGPKSTSRRRK